MSETEPEVEPVQIPAIVNEKATTVDPGRVGVRLLDPGQQPFITVDTGGYDFSGRGKTVFDTGSYLHTERLGGRSVLPPQYDADSDNR